MTLYSINALTGSQCDNALMGIKLTVLDRYIAQEIIVSCLTVAFVLLTVVMSAELVHLLKFLAEGQIPADSLVNFMVNSILEYTITLVPLSLFLGVLLAFGRLYKDSEMTAIMSSGVGPMQWNRPLLMVAIPVSLICLLLMLYVSPWVSQQRDAIKSELQTRSESSQFAAGQFNSSRSGKAIFFMESNDSENGMMNSVFHKTDQDGENHVDIAQSASSFHDSNDRLFTVMQHGQQYIGSAGDANYRVIKYEEYGVLMPSSEIGKHVDNKSRTTHELWDETFPPLRAELQWRLTVPIAALISALIALPLSHTSPRGGRFAKMALAMLVYLVYSNMLGVGKTWLIQGVVPFWVGTWWVHITALVVLALLWFKEGYFKQRRITA